MCATATLERYADRAPRRNIHRRARAPSASSNAPIPTKPGARGPFPVNASAGEDAGVDPPEVLGEGVPPEAAETTAGVVGHTVVLVVLDALGVELVVLDGVPVVEVVVDAGTVVVVETTAAAVRGAVVVVVEVVLDVVVVEFGVVVEVVLEVELGVVVGVVLDVLVVHGVVLVVLGVLVVEL